MSRSTLWSIGTGGLTGVHLLGLDDRTDEGKAEVNRISYATLEVFVGSSLLAFGDEIEKAELSMLFASAADGAFRLGRNSSVS